MKKTIYLTFFIILIANGCENSSNNHNAQLQLGQTNFSATLPVSDKPFRAGGVCVLDTINGTVTKSATVTKADPLTISGWAVDDVKGTIPEQVIARLTSSNGSQVFYASTSDRVSRPDVAAHLKNPVLEKSGFNLTATLEAVPSGQYTLELLQPTATSLLLCADKGQVEVR